LCGRFNLFSSIEIITEEINVERVLFEPPPRYNIAPTQMVAAILDDQVRVLDGLRWGLIPPWSKDDHASAGLINARVESLFEKPSFGPAILRKRCIIPADGFFEWQHTRSGNLPHYIRRTDLRPFLLGGIYEDWTSPGGENVRSCAIITTSADERISPVHDRMPLILSREKAESYLEPSRMDRSSIEPVLTVSKDVDLEMYRVGTEVNSTSVEGKGLIAPIQHWF
jgi:putative SOS response-associated peptidase YedK